MTVNPPDFIQHYQQRVNTALTRYLPPIHSEPQQLHEAMRYAVLNGGKRLRPLLVYTTGRALHVPEDQLDSAACAVEFIHAYSLIHDDLPAMDNDDFRRGLPTCHKRFGEATAILAGDALQTLAFQIIAEDTSLSEEQRLAMITHLARHTGAEGMVGGQALDLASQGKTLDSGTHEKINRRKTAALIQSSVRLGGIAANANESLLAELDHFSLHLGLAFQLRDDVHDKDGEAHTLEITAAKEKIKLLSEKACQHFHGQTSPLCDLLAWGLSM